MCVNKVAAWPSPSALGEPSLAAFEHLLGDERRGHRRWPTGVEREMGNDLAQFALFEPVVERALQVADQLLLAAERYQSGARDQAAVALGEAGALPYLPEQHPLAEFDERRDDVADLVTRWCRLLWRHGLSLSRLRPSRGYPSFVDYNSGAGRPISRREVDWRRHAAHRLANRDVEARLGRACVDTERGQIARLQ